MANTPSDQPTTGQSGTSPAPTDSGTSPVRAKLSGNKVSVDFTIDDLVNRLIRPGIGLVQSDRCGGCNGCTGCSHITESPTHLTESAPIDLTKK